MAFFTEYQILTRSNSLSAVIKQEITEKNEKMKLSN